MDSLESIVVSTRTTTLSRTASFTSYAETGITKKELSTLPSEIDITTTPVQGSTELTTFLLIQR